MMITICQRILTIVLEQSSDCRQEHCRSSNSQVEVTDEDGQDVHACPVPVIDLADGEVIAMVVPAMVQLWVIEWIEGLEWEVVNGLFAAIVVGLSSEVP